MDDRVAMGHQLKKARLLALILRHSSEVRFSLLEAHRRQHERWSGRQLNNLLSVMGLLLHSIRREGVTTVDGEIRLHYLGSACHSAQNARKLARRGGRGHEAFWLMAEADMGSAIDCLHQFCRASPTLLSLVHQLNSRGEEE